MIREFLKDIRGNYALLTAIAIVPIMGALALAVDYAEMSRQRQETFNALDAAGIATARRLVDNVTDEVAIAYAQDFFESNLNAVNPSDTTLTVLLPKNNTGGGTLKLCAVLEYVPYFFQTFQELIGKPRTEYLDFNACTEVRLKNTLEVALVLDNSTSMTLKGKGSTKTRMELLKEAATELVETIAAQGDLVQQVDSPVQFAVVPFSASVNIGSDKNEATWMDTEGISPIHHENFDWSAMATEAYRTANPNKYLEQVGTGWRKKGSGWGETQEKWLTRFSLFETDVLLETSKNKVNGKYPTKPYASWAGCVEARPSPYNVNDDPADPSKPETMFVPMFAPDEAGHVWRDMNRDGDTKDDADLNNADFGYANNWWSDWEDTSDAKKRARDGQKYFRAKQHQSTTKGTGPNFSCTTKAITPLTDVTTGTGEEDVKAAIKAMTPNGYTDVPEGMAWGWRVLSHGEPFTEGRPDNERGNDKVVIVLTDGENTYTDLGDYESDEARHKSTYAAYGYIGEDYMETKETRLFMDTDTDVDQTDFSGDNYSEALNQHFAALCKNIKGGENPDPEVPHVIVMTVALDLNEKDKVQKKQIEALSACSSESRFTAGKKLFWNTTGKDLETVFEEIANELSNLRIVS